MSRFRKTLKKIDKQYKDAISLDTYPSIIKAIENNISSTSTSKKEHINHAKEAQQLNTKIKCPVCGSYLVIRTAKEITLNSMDALLIQIADTQGQ